MRRVLALESIVDPVSLYEPVYDNGGDAICAMDQVRDTKNTDESWTERIALKDALKLLDERERRILSLRFYEGKPDGSLPGGRNLPGPGLPFGKGRHQYH